MTRLSLPLDRLKPRYSVVVIGTGYGGAIAASRMARAGQLVCVLERGRELQPGEYPKTLHDAAHQMQTDSPACHSGSRTGLFDVRVNADINVVLGCGLGGTSLINANVGLRAENRVFEDPRWPAAFRARPQLMEKGYQRAQEILRPTPVPESFPTLPKLEAHQQSAEAMGAKFYRTPLYVNFETFATGHNPFGVKQEPCNGCGDCVSGCNNNAKNTTLMNYLPDAVNHGAEIFTELSVRHLERQGQKWVVHLQPLNLGQEVFDAPPLFVVADIVILGAGTLGSTEILLRSAARGLPLSGQVGSHFTGNGDVLGFAYNSKQEINGTGFGDQFPAGRPAVGPCISSVIDLRNQPNLEDGMVIEEGSIPGALATLLPGGLALAASLGGGHPHDLGEALAATEREMKSFLLGPYQGAIRQTQTYLVMTHDSGAGRMHLENDRLRISWPDVGGEAIFNAAACQLQRASQALDGIYTPNPTWHSLQTKSLVSVHPLGGCVMGETSELGVVNHKGQVFCGSTGSSVYENLYVDDGSIIPRPLGVNPSLTIAALAERCCALIAEDRNWNIDYTINHAPALPDLPRKLGIEFTETMKGFFCPGATDFAVGEKLGQASHTALEFTLTIRSEDVQELIRNPAHPATLAGTVLAPSLSAAPLEAVAGVFNLLTQNPKQVKTRNMGYGMRLVSPQGDTWYFEGEKIVHENTLFEIWPRTSTLNFTLYAGDSSRCPELGRGILRIEPADFARQITTMQVTHAANVQERLNVLKQFGTFFAGSVYETYSGIFSRPTPFDPKAAPRLKRTLRVGAPAVYPVTTKDGVALRLTRYQGGTKGPVILSHGLGVSSLIFSLDTIETNLLEYLYAAKYDVWLLDYRNSILLPASRERATGDQVATFDYPAAVARVREVTGAPSVQMVVHCWGSTTFFMAMLGGLQGVRSAVCSQIATHIVPPVGTRLKTGLHLPSFLDAMGIKSLDAFSSTEESTFQKLFDGALRFYHTQLRERCNSPTCHRITFMYAPLYNHAQLNQATHDTLHETFGIANITSFKHLETLTNRGHLVSAEDEDIYLPHLERLALPITFIHGADNECFLPKSTSITFDILAKRNGSHLYQRHVIPGYGHIDCIFGKNAATDVFPKILQALETAGA